MIQVHLQRGVFLNKTAVFVQRCRPQYPDLSARQRRFQDIRRIHGALSVAGAHDIMEFINHQNDIAQLFGLVHNTLHAALELAAECHYPYSFLWNYLR